MWGVHIVIITFSVILNWTIIRCIMSVNISKQDRLRLDATCNCVSHGSALFTNFTFALQQPDSHTSIARNGCEINMHLLIYLNVYEGCSKGEFHPIWNLHRVLPTHRI